MLRPFRVDINIISDREIYFWFERPHYVILKVGIVDVVLSLYNFDIRNAGGFLQCQHFFWF